MAKKDETKEEVDCSKYVCKRGKCGHKHWGGGGSGGGAVYFFGLVGSLIYFFQHLGPATVNNVVMAVIKSIIWPGLFVYRFLEYFKF